MIVWLWEMDGESAELTVYDPRDGVTETAAIERFAGEDWGVDFDGVVSTACAPASTRACSAS